MANKTELAQFPEFRISILPINKRNPYPDVLAHQAAVSDLIVKGNYEIKESSVFDDPENFQILLIMQRRVDVT